MRRTEEGMTTAFCDDKKDEQFISECQAALKHQQYMPVTCNGVSAVLNRHRLGSGGKGKCIEFEGDLLTPNEFQARCGKASSKDWKRSIRFRGRPLSRLIDQKILNCHAISCICAACSDDMNVQSPIRYFKKWNRKRKAQSVPNSILVEFSKPTQQQNVTDGRACRFKQHLHSEDNRDTSELAKTISGFKITETTNSQPSLVAGKPTRPSETVCSYKDLHGCDVNDRINHPDKSTEQTMIGQCHDTSPKGGSGSTVSYSCHKSKSEGACAAPVLPVNPLSMLHDQIVNDIVNEQKCWWHLETVAENLIRQTVALRAIVSQTKEASMSSKANILIQLRTILSSTCDRNASTAMSSTSDTLKDDRQAKSTLGDALMPGHLLPPTMRHPSHLNRSAVPLADWVYRRDSQGNPFVEGGDKGEHFTEDQQRMSGLLAPYHPDAANSFRLSSLQHSLDLSNVPSTPCQLYSAIPACFETPSPDPSLPEAPTEGTSNADRSRPGDLGAPDSPRAMPDGRTPSKMTSVHDLSRKRDLLKTGRRHTVNAARTCRRCPSVERPSRKGEATVGGRRTSTGTRDAIAGRKRMPRSNLPSSQDLTSSASLGSLCSSCIRSRSVSSSLSRLLALRPADKCETSSTAGIAGSDKTDALSLTSEICLISGPDVVRSKSWDGLSKCHSCEDVACRQPSETQLEFSDKEQRLSIIGSRKRPTNRTGDKVDINFRDVCNLPDPPSSHLQRISRAKLNSQEPGMSEEQIFDNDTPKRIRILHEYNETPDFTR